MKIFHPWIIATLYNYILLYNKPCQHKFYKMWCKKLGSRLRGSEIHVLSMEGYHIKNCVIGAFNSGDN